MGILPRDKVRALLKKHQIAFIDSYVATNERQCASCARRAGFPAVLNAGSLGTTVVRQDTEAASQFLRFRQTAKQTRVRLVVTVRRQLDGSQAACGTRWSPQFGPTVYVTGSRTVGRLAPLADGDIDGMVAEAGLTGLAGLIRTLSALAVKQPKLSLSLDVVLTPHPVAVGFRATI